MGIGLNGLTRYAKACGVKSILQTTPEALKGVDLASSKLRPLTSDVAMFRRIEELRGEELDRLLRVVIGYTDMSGNFAHCFNLERYPNLLFRVDREFSKGLEAPLSGCRLVPIKYPSSEIRHNPNLGLPLLAVFDKANGTTPKFVSASEVASTKMQILRRVQGGYPDSGYYKELLKLEGNSWLDTTPRRNFEELHRYCQVLNKPEDARRFVEDCESVRQTGCENTQAFYENYRGFVESYLATLDRMSNLPRHTFEKAATDIKTLTRKYGVEFDFQHPRNTLIDFENEAINFIDLDLSQCTGRPNMCRNTDAIDGLRDALLGKYYSRIDNDIVFPNKYIVLPEDKQRFEEIFRRLLDRIYLAW